MSYQLKLAFCALPVRKDPVARLHSQTAHFESFSNNGNRSLSIIIVAAKITAKKYSPHTSQSYFIIIDN